MAFTNLSVFRPGFVNDVPGPLFCIYDKTRKGRNQSDFRRCTIRKTDVSANKQIGRFVDV